MKILVRGANWIGDAVMSVPALRELRRIFPDDRISLHTRAWADGIFRDAAFLDEIITFEPQRFRLREVRDNAQFLKDDAFDLAILFPNSFESSLTTLLARIPRRVGYNKDLRGLLLTDPIPVPEWKNRRHEAFYYLNLIAEVERRLLGRETVGKGELSTGIDISAERIEEAARWLPASDGRIVGLGVGSTNSRAKRWGVTQFAELADALAREGASVILLGSDEDIDVARAVEDLTRCRPANLAGRTSLEDAAAILARIDLFISNDMGLAHLAPAVGTDTIVIFGPTNPETTRPFSSRALVMRHDVECSPCMLRDCPIDHRCMTRLTSEEVLAAALDRLSGMEADA